MSTAEQPVRVVRPPLVEGQRLDQPEFHRRYEAMPPGTRAELINGVVFMPGPVSPEHADAAGKVVTWLNFYELRTPGVQTLDGATVILRPSAEPEPDALLRIRPEHGGRTGKERGLIKGAPELVVEVSKATRYVDLGPKLDDYERAEIREYLVRALEPDEVIWHVLQDGHLVALPPGDDGLYESSVFPGLWLDPRALLSTWTKLFSTFLTRRPAVSREKNPRSVSYPLLEKY
jgi:hypothetical protein